MICEMRNQIILHKYFNFVQYDYKLLQVLMLIIKKKKFFNLFYLRFYFSIRDECLLF